MLDMIELQNLTDEQQQRYMSLERLMESDGWPLIAEWAAAEAEAAKQRALNAQTWEENRIAVGQLFVFEQVAQLDEGIENEFRQLATSNVEDSSRREFIDEQVFE